MTSDQDALEPRKSKDAGEDQPGAPSASGDARTIAAPAEVSDVELSHPISHYLYFPSESAARGAEADLDKHTFRAETRRGALGPDWLLLARHQMIPSKDAVDATRVYMEQLAAKFGGTYDGWEAAVRRQSAT